eukprot:5872120-Pleurochrysis_carterae.AAC.2
MRPTRSRNVALPPTLGLALVQGPWARLASRPLTNLSCFFEPAIWPCLQDLRRAHRVGQVRRVTSVKGGRDYQLWSGAKGARATVLSIYATACLEFAHVMFADTVSIVLPARCMCCAAEH